jgi:putative ABC transport system ATP-binding protein
VSILTRASGSPASESGPHTPLIALRGVEKSYPIAGGVQYVLRRVTLDITAGEFVTIMGPSGAGKSTLLAILGMLDHIYSGEYYFRGHAVHKLSVKQRQGLAREHIGFVFQQYHLLDDLTVAENLSVPLDYRGVSKSDRAARVADVLDRFNIVGKKDLYPRQLSGGQQQLVGIARAVVAEPALILADEPTGNLHSAQAREIMELFAKLNAAGTTIIQVTHSDENARYGRRTINLRDGWMEP